jgi:hypothetical protein
MELKTEALPNQPVLVSPSRIACFVECPKKYDYIYNQKLKPKGPNKKHYDKGLYVHEIQLVQAGIAPGDDFAKASVVKRIQQDVEHLGLASPELLPLFSIVLKRLQDFVAKQSPLIDSDMEVVAIESELAYPVNSKFTLFGLGDLLFRKLGTLRIRDHKSGDRTWKQEKAQFHNQLIYYALICYLNYGVAPVGEINFIHTKDFVNKVPSFEDTFSLFRVSYSAKELEKYFEDICKLIEHMLSSEPIPHYGEQCNYCPFKAPCLLERKGIDNSQLILMNYEARPETHGKFTEEHSADDSAD